MDVLTAGDGGEGQQLCVGVVILAARLEWMPHCCSLPIVLMALYGQVEKFKEKCVGDVAVLSRPLPQSHLVRVAVDVFRHGEDNLVNREVAAKRLSRLGCKCQVAANGVQALEASRKEEYDVVLIDVPVPIKRAAEVLNADSGFVSSRVPEIELLMSQLERRCV